MKPRQTPDPSRPAKASPIHSITIVTCFRIRRPFSGRPSSGTVAGWSSPVARQAHNLKAAGSNPAPATNLNCEASAEAAASLDPDPKASIAANAPRTSIRKGAFGSAGQGIKRISSISARIRSRTAAASSPASASSLTSSLACRISKTFFAYREYLPIPSFSRTVTTRSRSLTRPSRVSAQCPARPPGEVGGRLWNASHTGLPTIGGYSRARR